MPARAAQAVLLTGGLQDGAGEVLTALRARLGRGVKILVSDVFAPLPNVLEETGAAALGLYMTTTDVPPVEHSLTPAGRTFARDFAASNSPTGYVLPAAQAAEVVLAAIARSDGTRGSVLEQLQATKVKDGILGSFSFDRGDITPPRIAILRVTGKTPPQYGLADQYQGAVLDRVITVPSRLSP